MGSPWSNVSAGDDGAAAAYEPPPSTRYDRMNDRLGDLMYYSTEPNLPDEAYQKHHPGAKRENEDSVWKWFSDLFSGGG